MPVNCCRKYITEFKIKKATDKLSFIEGRHAELKGEFLKSQKSYAWFGIKTRNISTAIAATEEERLKSEYTIALSVYNELTKQMEQAKIQVEENIPVFSVIQPAKVPLEKTKPKKVVILIVWIFLGGILGTGSFLWKEIL